MHNPTKRKKLNVRGLVLTLLHMACYCCFSLSLFCSKLYLMKDIVENGYSRFTLIAAILLILDCVLSYINYRSDYDNKSKQVVQLFDLVISIPIAITLWVDITATLVTDIYHSIEAADTTALLHNALLLLIEALFLFERLFTATRLRSKTNIFTLLSNTNDMMEE